MSSGALYLVALVRSDVTENVLSPYSGVLSLIVFHSRESFPDDSGLQLLIVSLSGEADKQCLCGNTTVESYHPREP
jgi:hypothetical protein